MRLKMQMVNTMRLSYGGRSFSILRASDLEMIYDSGSDIEQRVLDLLPERFNANYESTDDIKVDDRSDDKGQKKMWSLVK